MKSFGVAVSLETQVAIEFFRPPIGHRDLQIDRRVPRIDGRRLRPFQQRRTEPLPACLGQKADVDHVPCRR